MRCFQMVAGAKPSESRVHRQRGRLCLLSNFQERKMNVFMGRPPASLFPICQGGPHTMPYQIVPDQTKPYPQPSRHTRMVPLPYSSPPYISSPQLTKIDQNRPYLDRRRNRPLYISEESTPPTFCLHSPQGAATTCHQCFFIVSFPPRQIFFVFV